MHWVVTNLLDAPPLQVIEQCHGVWQVGAMFRVRPLFHCKDRRIQTHVAVAFTTLMCVRHMQWRITLSAHAWSSEAI